MSKAVALLRGDNANLCGVVTFTQDSADAKTRIQAWFMDLTPGLHGLHIHQFGDLSDGCKSAGPHYNPFGTTHGGRDTKTRHFGADFGNIEVKPDGTATLDFVDPETKLIGPYSVIGRSLVLHAGEDDLGLGGDEESLKTGNSGPRVACGIIGLAEYK